MNGFHRYRAAIVEEAVRVTSEIADQLKTPAGIEVWGNYLFDLPGPRALRRNLSPSEQLFRSVFYGFTEIAEAYERLQDCDVYVRRFPYRGSRVSNPRHLSHAIEVYLNENYVLQQRLLGYLRRVRRYACKRAADVEVSEVFEPTERLVLTAFDGIVRTRGANANETRYKDDDVSRSDTLGLLVNHGRSVTLRGFYIAETSRIRRKWQGIVESNNRQIKRLLDLYFSALYPFVFGPKVRLVGNRSA